jgi:hypothetical protein
MVAFAPSGANRPGSTHLKTTSLTYDIEQPTLSAKKLNAQGLPTSYVARFLPWVSGILASSPALEELTGSSTPVALRLDESHYLKNGFDASQSFVSLVNPISYTMGAQKGGGLAAPASKVEALSRTLGPTAAPDALAMGKVDISAFAGMKILGLLDIKDFLPAWPDEPELAFTTPPDALPPSEGDLDRKETRWNAPSLTTRRLLDENGNLTAVETRYLWKPQLTSERTLGVLTLQLSDADLLLDARLTRRVSPSGPDSNGSSMVVRGRLRDATLRFKDAIAVYFEELSFYAEEGRKMDVSARGVDLTFLGPLEFVNTLRKIMPSDGFSDPPFVNVNAQGISAGYTLGIPSVGVGIFSLQNIALGATLSVPFADKPASVRFAISERHKPFLVTVTIFGGGGFFALAVSASGLEQVEAAIEFGGNISLNLGVASGGVYVMAGIYFNLTKSSVELTGYLRCGGYLEVLGLISISIEFYLSFTYLKKDGPPQGSEVWGQATVNVCVKIAFFSKSVSLSVERHFAGSDGDPTFGDTHTEDQWKTYLQAFGL